MRCQGQGRDAMRTRGAPGTRQVEPWFKTMLLLLPLATAFAWCCSAFAGSLWCCDLRVGHGQAPHVPHLYGAIQVTCCGEGMAVVHEHQRCHASAVGVWGSLHTQKNTHHVASFGIEGHTVVCIKWYLSNNASCNMHHSL